MHRGSCLCGGIGYELDAPLTEIGMCHCGMCRKASGTAFATNAPVPADRFRVTRGAELLSAYQSSPGKQRVFCRVCGSPIYSKSEQKPGVLRIRLGSLDTAVGRQPDYHFFVDAKADWHEIEGSLPRYPGFAAAR
jgi:hypothetical protein